MIMSVYNPTVSIDSDALSTKGWVLPEALGGHTVRTGWRLLARQRREVLVAELKYSQGYKGGDSVDTESSKMDFGAFADCILRDTTLPIPLLSKRKARSKPRTRWWKLRGP